MPTENAPNKALITLTRALRRGAARRRPTPFVGRFAADHWDKYAPDGVKNQIEGTMLQSLSRALKEEVRFDQSRITSADWGMYPILTFSDAPKMDARTSRRWVRVSLPP